MGERDERVSLIVISLQDLISASQIRIRFPCPQTEIIDALFSSIEANKRIPIPDSSSGQGMKGRNLIYALRFNILAFVGFLG
jgi:hypothetical protein